MGYQVKPLSPIPNSRPPSSYTYTQPTSPKSPVNFVQYHQQYREEYPPIEFNDRFPRRRSRSRTRRKRVVRSLDFEVGLREDTASTSSEAPSYHRYPEEDDWEDRGRGRRMEREYPKADVEAALEAADEDTPQLPMAVLEARPRRGNPAPRPTANLHPYVCALAPTLRNLRAHPHRFRSPLLHPPLVSYLESIERGTSRLINFVDLVDLSMIPHDHHT